MQIPDCGCEHQHITGSNDVESPFGADFLTLDLTLAWQLIEYSWRWTNTQTVPLLAQGMRGGKSSIPS